MRLWPPSRLRQTLVVGFLGGCLSLVVINALVYRQGMAGVVSAQQAAPADAIMVLGCMVYPNGTLSPILKDRLDVGLNLYQSGKAPKLLVSGDHGEKDYDEVNAMRRYLEARGVPPADIFMDHAGFDTYSSMMRAREVFLVHRLLIVTQAFHLPRAVYIARGLGLTAQGVASDLRQYVAADYYQLRECGARLKAFRDVLTQRQPAFLGPLMPITGDGRVTRDRATEAHDRAT